MPPGIQNNSQEPPSTDTQEQAQGQDARYSVSRFAMYYDVHSDNVLLVWPEDDIHIFNENNLLSGLVEEWHASNKTLHDARQECVDVIDDAPDPAHVNQSLWNRAVAKYDEAQQRANTAHAAFRAVLEELAPLEQTDTPAARAAMFRSGGPTKITELIPIFHVNTQNGPRPVGAGVRARPVYVRTNVTGHDRWIVEPLNSKPGATPSNDPPKNGGVPRQNFIKDGRFDVAEFKKQIFNLKELLEIKYQFNLTEYLPESWQMRDDTLTEWAKWLNSHAHTGPLGTEDGFIQFDAAAQFMRFTHGVALSGDVDFKKMAVNLKAEGRAELALLEGKSRLAMNVPDERGWMLSMPARDNLNADLGLLRIVLELVLQGTVGAGISAELGIKVEGGRLLQDRAQHEAPPPALQGSTTPYRRTGSMAQRTDGGLNTGLSAFAGAQATGELGAAVEWRNPEEGHIYKPFAKIVLGVAVSAGAGIELALKIGFDDRGLYIEAKAALCWGVGGKGSFKFRVNPDLILEFMIWFTHQLRNVDFQRLENLLDAQTYAGICRLQYLVLYGAIKIGQGVQMAMLTYQYLREGYKTAQNRTELTNRINSGEHENVLKFTTPETKGMILALLADSNFADEYLFWSNSKMNPLTLEPWLAGRLGWRKTAILKVFRWVQSQSEYRNILQHMNLEPDAPKGDWRANERKLKEFLDKGEINVPGIRIISTDYDGDLEKIIEALPEVTMEEMEAIRRDFAQLHSMAGAFLKNLYDALPGGAFAGFPFASAFETMRDTITDLVRGRSTAAQDTQASAESQTAAYVAREHPLFRGGEVPNSPQYALLGSDWYKGDDGGTEIA